MRFVATTLLTLGVQLVLGTLIFAVGGCAVARYPGYRGGTRRRRVASWSRAARSMLRALPLATALGLAGIGIHLALGLVPRSVTPWASPLVFLVVGSLATSSSYLVLQSGRLEAAGRSRAARRQVRLCGKLMFLGIFAQLVLMWADLLFRPRFRVAIVRDDPIAAIGLAGGMLALGCAAFIGLLAALTGKPRPSGGFATLIYLGGLAGILGAAGLVLGA